MSTPIEVKRYVHFHGAPRKGQILVLTPLSLEGTLVRENVGYLLVPLTLLFAFVFAIVQRTGEVNEEPFENRITDVPLSATCRIIERDARETLGETDLPPKLEPKDSYLW